jgi:hypothetical protein
MEVIEDEDKVIDLNSLPDGAVNLEMDHNTFKYPGASAKLLEQMREDPELYDPKYLSEKRSKFFRECTKDDNMSNHKFNSITDLYNSLNGKFDQITDQTFNDDTIGMYIVDQDRIGQGFPVGTIFISENKEERKQLLMNIFKAIWAIDYNNDKRGYTQGDNHYIIAFLVFTDYDDVETFFLVMKLLYKLKYINIIPTNERHPLHNSDEDWFTSNLSIWWPLFQTLVNERPVFFRSMRKLKTIDNFIIGCEFVQKNHAQRCLQIPGTMKPNEIKLFYKNFLTKGFKGMYIFLATIFFKIISKDKYMSIVADDPGLPKKVIEFVSTHQIFFKNYSTGDAETFPVITTQRPFFKVELTQEELNETEQKYFTEKKLNKLSKIYNKTKFKHDGKTFAPIKVKRTNKFSSMFGGKKKYTKREWVKIKKHKTKRK